STRKPGSFAYFVNLHCSLLPNDQSFISDNNGGDYCDNFDCYLILHGGTSFDKSLRNPKSDTSHIEDTIMKIIKERKNEANQVESATKDSECIHNRIGSQKTEILDEDPKNENNSPTKLIIVDGAIGKANVLTSFKQFDNKSEFDIFKVKCSINDIWPKQIDDFFHQCCSKCLNVSQGMESMMCCNSESTTLCKIKLDLMFPDKTCIEVIALGKNFETFFNIEEKLLNHKKLKAKLEEKIEDLQSIISRKIYFEFGIGSYKKDQIFIHQLISTYMQ
ncbi:MAG: hypothetical protein MHMPM18_004439, partial [Marteilia pararefringens]